MTAPSTPDDPWPHRLSFLLAVATFPVIWVGGLVTTQDAGMAVPDWPTTYGYNPLAYPLDKWLAGPFDLFIEHGHRLLAGVINLLALALAIAVWKSPGHRPLRGWAIASLALVLFQDVLGGMRVEFDARLLAQVHACVGPVFFTLGVVMTTLTSRRATSAKPTATRPSGASWSAGFLTIVAWLQIVLGAQIRHVSPSTVSALFEAAVWMHVLTAAFLVLGTVSLAVKPGQCGLLVRTLPLILVAVQIVLGAAAWVVRYAWPSILPQPDLLAGYVVEAQGFWPAIVRTAHVANGSLILASLARAFVVLGGADFVRQSIRGESQTGAAGDHLSRLVVAEAGR
jgi:cytochrome c oxidase assembly protein subunit 15